MRVGIVGYGRQGKRRAEWLSKTEGVEISCVYDLDAMNCQDDKYAIVRCRPGSMVESCFQEVMQFSDAVAICTPPDSHYEYARQALEAGKHVLVEKPLTLDPDQADELVELADKNGPGLHVGLNMRYRDPILYARERIGQVGAVKRVWASIGHGQFKDPDDPRFKMGGGPLLDLGTHLADLCLYLLGYPGVEGYSTEGDDRYGRCHLDLDGVRVTVWANYTEKHDGTATLIKIDGSMGWMTIGMGPVSEQVTVGGIDGVTTQQFKYPDDCWARDCEAFVRTCRGEQSNARHAAQLVRYLQTQTGAR